MSQFIKTDQLWSIIWSICAWCWHYNNSNIIFYNVWSISGFQVSDRMIDMLIWGTFPCEKSSMVNLNIHIEAPMILLYYKCGHAWSLLENLWRQTANINALKWKSWLLSSYGISGHVWQPNRLVLVHPETFGIFYKLKQRRRKNW